MQRSYTQTQLTWWWSSTGELQPLLHGAFIAGEIRQQVCWANLMFSHWGAGFFGGVRDGTHLLICWRTRRRRRGD